MALAVYWQQQLAGFQLLFKIQQVLTVMVQAKHLQHQQMQVHLSVIVSIVVLVYTEDVSLRLMTFLYKTILVIQLHFRSKMNLMALRFLHTITMLLRPKIKMLQ